MRTTTAMVKNIVMCYQYLIDSNINRLNNYTWCMILSFKNG
jgi:hypothetical protein